MKTLFVFLFCGLILEGQTAPKAAPPKAAPAKPAVILWKQEPDGFRGFKFGALRSNLGFIPEEGYFTAKDSSGNYCVSAERSLGAGAERCERIEDPIGDVGVTFTYYFRDDKLVEISGSFLSTKYDDLRDIFIAAYGKPHQTQHEVERTAIGVPVSNEALLWNGKQVVFFMTKYLDTITDGEFSITLKSEDAERERLKREAKSKAVQSLK